MIKSFFQIVFLLISCFVFGEKIINVKDYGAKGNGIADDTKSFQLAVDQLKNLGGKIIIPKGDYRIQHITFFSNAYSNITLSGDNAKILQITSPKRKSVLNGAFKTYAQRYAADGCFVFDAMVSNQNNDDYSIKNILIEGLTFISDVKGLGFDELLHQVSAHGVSSFTIKNCSFIGFLGDAVAINGGTDFSVNRNAYNKNIQILNSNFDGINNNNRQGISIYYADGFEINNCNFKNITRKDMPGAIDIESDKPTNITRNGKIINCTFQNIGGISAIVLNLKQPSKINDYSYKNFLISGCTFKNVPSAFCIIGYPEYVNMTSKDGYATVIQNCNIDQANSPADIRSAYGVLFKNVTFRNITSKILNVVSETGAKFITFEACNFINIANPNGLGFTGATREINFENCTFENFSNNAITINDSNGLGYFVGNKFNSSSTKNALPIVTSKSLNKAKINRLNIKNNTSKGNFNPFDLSMFIN
ncbi:MAG: glycosyl hydrolase family 28-related protein [Chryseobacterium joostei]